MGYIWLNNLDNKDKVPLKLISTNNSKWQYQSLGVFRMETWQKESDICFLNIVIDWPAHSWALRAGILGTINGTPGGTQRGGVPQEGWSQWA